MQERLYTVTARASHPGGRSTVTIRCPFCDCSTKVRTWSLAGSGKRCECGALFSSMYTPGGGTATREEQR